MSRPERCNGEDDDCDGAIDEGADDSCALTRATARCLGGACILDACEPGYFNCNKSAVDGCETAADARTCGECGRSCEAAQRGTSSPAGMAMMRSDDAHADSGTPEGGEPTSRDDAGSECDAESGCRGRPDGTQPSNGPEPSACVAAKPSGQTAACDRCACDKCTAEVGACFMHEDRTWVSACSAVTRCFGSNIAAGRCDESDCGLNALGVCGQAEARSVSWGNWAYSCSRSPGAPRTPCDASVEVRECLRARCSEVCKLGSP